MKKEEDAKDKSVKSKKVHDPSVNGKAAPEQDGVPEGSSNCEPQLIAFLRKTDSENDGAATIEELMRTRAHFHKVIETLATKVPLIACSTQLYC